MVDFISLHVGPLPLLHINHFIQREDDSEAPRHESLEAETTRRAFHPFVIPPSSCDTGAELVFFDHATPPPSTRIDPDISRICWLYSRASHKRGARREKRATKRVRATAQPKRTTFNNELSRLLGVVLAHSLASFLRVARFVGSPLVHWFHHLGHAGRAKRLRRGGAGAGVGGGLAPAGAWMR